MCTLNNYCQCGCGAVVKKRFVHGHTWKGKKLPEKTRAKIRTSLMGHTNSDEAKAKMSISHTSLTPSEETRANMGAARKRNWDSITPALGSKQNSNKITELQFWGLVVLQKARCWMCLYPLAERGSIVVDHDHETGVVRGIAHRICNLNW